MEQFTGNGIFNIFKPTGMTSHDVVGYARRALGRPKCGHAGTLDPAACGVLLLLVNKGTKLSNRAMALPKTYRAEMTLGIATGSGDAQGDITREETVEISPETLLAALPAFTGAIQQTPPMTSAVKVGGKKLYKLAHRGVEIERASRTVTIYELKLIDFDPSPPHPRALLEIRCSSGTYVRTLVEDIAASLGFPAFTSFLIRTAVGPFTSDRAAHPEQLAAGAAGLLVSTDVFETA